MKDDESVKQQRSTEFLEGGCVCRAFESDAMPGGVVAIMDYVRVERTCGNFCLCSTGGESPQALCAEQRMVDPEKSNALNEGTNVDLKRQIREEEATVGEWWGKIGARGETRQQGSCTAPEGHTKGKKVRAHN